MAITHRDPTHHTAHFAGKTTYYVAGVQTRLQGIGDPQLGGIGDDVFVAVLICGEWQNLIDKGTTAPGFGAYDMFNRSAHRVIRQVLGWTETLLRYLCQLW